MRRFLSICGLLVGALVALPVLAQDQPSAIPAGPQNGTNAVTADYPRDRAGVMIGEGRWTPLASQTPFKTKAAHSIAASLSYGIVPAKIVAEYEGEHAAVVTAERRPILCICHITSLPGAPVLVRLHPKKTARELDGGRMTVYPIVGNSKVADANKTDLVAADVSQPDPQVWLVRPQQPLEPGEYALMLGSQNIMIYPFTVETELPAAGR